MEQWNKEWDRRDKGLFFVPFFIKIVVKRQQQQKHWIPIGDTRPGSGMCLLSFNHGFFVIIFFFAHIFFIYPAK